MLDKFKQAKKEEIDRLKALEEKGALPKAYAGGRLSFAESLKVGHGIKIIAEYKRASPSKGVINKDLDAQEVARIYSQNGAAAISVLTEEKYFQGQLEFLSQMAGYGLPLLRKDFIFHPLQIVATAATPASALLLIVRLTPEVSVLKDLIARTYELGLDPVVEIFNHDELKIARKAGAKIIQVNNRDLDTLKVDIMNSYELIRYKEEGELWICASGIENREEILKLKDEGFDAFLIGTWLMSAPDPGKALQELRAKG
ncbi:indole-3-glycerol-phosphate synthase [Desulfohalobiaceae bacterium Ax17]|uniref:indole-3-glycerol phosphate synthase TrpC n=1 Tax=Desulfovulcanus ferrireducens TaxID=2831190 RepID=UPI00207BB180|nr:indole-3-glycerol-phosphate synthase [Desulfovulcanus ferrireducens]MBT8762621.1 indole-3-glycerol-phosphate synthase [Desulfovulcanus ferrireducens]